MGELNNIPSLYEYGGGREKYQLLMEVFYKAVAKDPLIGPIFEHMDEEHVINVSYFLIEVFCGPRLYTEKFGEKGLQRMVGKHIGKKLSEDHRKRWMDLILETSDKVGLPMDPEFRSAFVGHIEWGTRVAQINSNLSSNPVTEQDVIPRWGWGQVKGPYDVVGSLFDKKNQ